MVEMFQLALRSLAYLYFEHVSNLKPSIIIRDGFVPTFMCLLIIMLYSISALFIKLRSNA